MISSAVSAVAVSVVAPVASSTRRTTSRSLLAGRVTGRRSAVVTNVGKSGINRLTGESEWVEVSDAAAAIEEGTELYQAKDYAGAIAKWEGALKLGGSGTKRDRSKPAELSLGEKQAIFYNLMCAHSTVEDVDRGLQALEAALRNGYCSAELYGFGKANEDYDRLMRDPDLATIRADARFQKIVSQYKVEPTVRRLMSAPVQRTYEHFGEHFGE